MDSVVRCTRTKVVMSSWRIDAFIIMSCLFLSLRIFLPLKSALCEIQLLKFCVFFCFSFFFSFLAALGLRCCVWAFSSCSEQGLLFVAVHGLLIAVPSLVAEHGL